MPATAIYATSSSVSNDGSANPLPQLLHTPLGTALVEIQGTLNIVAQDTSVQDSPIGRLEFPLLTSETPTDQQGPWMKKVYFYIGKNQRLVGEIKKLPTAFAVLRRREPSGRQGDGEELEIVDVVEWKMYFGSRPEFV